MYIIRKFQLKNVAVQTDEAPYQRWLEQIRRNEQERIEEHPEREFPRITAEMKVIIEKALTTHPNDRLRKDLYYCDIQTLQGKGLVNGVVINAYFDMIVERSMRNGYPSVYAYNTYFYTTFKRWGYIGKIRSYTERVDIFSYEFNFVPIHTGRRWCLAVIDHRLKKICYYDSYFPLQEDCKDLLLKYLCLEHEAKKGVSLEPYSFERMINIPRHMFSEDDGIFVLKYAEFMSRNAELTFTQNDMDSFRQRMIYELVTNKII